MRLRTLLVLWILAAAAVVSAQTVTNPTTAIFTASPDHAKVLADGTHAVTDYGLAITLSGASAPVTTLSVVQQNGGVMPTPERDEHDHPGDSERLQGARLRHVHGDCRRDRPRRN